MDVCRLIWSTLFAICALCAIRGVHASVPCEVRMRTESGELCGRVREAELGVLYASFRGVPYGKPPLGPRRFQELEQMEPWHEPRDATEDSPACPQKDLLYGRLTNYQSGMSEDCIYLNLHVPLQALPKIDKDLKRNETDQGTGLPILVMIHGGGFHTGSGLTDLHGPEYLMTKNVIVVTFNYRLNVFGFLSLKSAMIPGNQGLRDQLTLLRWVQRHARSFGGDPDNVSLMGHSAGATAAHLLSLSHAAKGLFHKLILLSGTALPNYYTPSPQYAKVLADNFVVRLGINSTDPEEIHRQLTEMPLINIIYAHTLFLHDLGVTSFVPVVEEEYSGITRVLDDDPLELIAQGRGKDYPRLMGFTNKEEEFFRWPCFSLDIMKSIQEHPSILLTDNLLHGQSSENIANLTRMVSERYFNGTPTMDKYLVLLGDKFFKQAAIKGAAWSALSGAPTYLYRYSYRSERSLIKAALWVLYEGAAHGEDLIQFFKTNSMIKDINAFPPSKRDDQMKDWMTAMVTNFMKCSTPTCSEDQSPWPPLSPDHLRYQSIEEPMKYVMSDITVELLNMLNFFDDLDEDYRRVTDRLKKRLEDKETRR